MNVRNHTDGSEIAIVGAGLCGMVLALYLAKRDLSVSLYENIPDPNAHTRSSSRATELDLSARGMLALHEIGLLSQVLAQAIPTERRVLFFPNQTQLILPHSMEGEKFIYNISRADLYQILLGAIRQEPRITLHFSHGLISVDPDNQSMLFKNEDTYITKSFSILFGCDGVNSVMQRELNPLNCNAMSHTHLYQEVKIPVEFSDRYLSIKSMYKWIDNNVSLLCHPRKTKDFAATLVVPYGETLNHNNIQQPIIQYFALETIDQPFHKIRSIVVPIQASKNILLLGDAAHGMLPFLGQGINCALEDCQIFNHQLTLSHGNFRDAINAYVNNRIKDTRAIIEMSKIEYREMISPYNPIQHVFYEKLQLQLTKRYTTFFKPYRYLLAFTHIPYSKIQSYQQTYRRLEHKIYNYFHKRDIDWHIVDKWLTTEFNEAFL